MKWIRRKPNAWVHGVTMYVCSVILISFSLWIMRPAVHRFSLAGFLVRTWITDDYGYPEDYEPPSCYVIERDGRIQVLGDGSRPSDEIWTKHESNLIWFELNYSSYGLFAPTKMHIEQWFGDSPYQSLAYPKKFQECSDRFRLGLTPDENGQLVVNSQLKEFNNYSEDRTLWSGYVINVIAILAVFWLLWALRWVPYQIRYHIQKRRYLRGLCPLCKYDVCATPDKCPECGWVHGGNHEKAKGE